MSQVGEVAVGVGRIATSKCKRLPSECGHVAERRTRIRKVVTP